LLHILGFLSNALTLDIGLSRRISHGDIGLKLMFHAVFGVRNMSSRSPLAIEAKA
ncbi:unnamed protein product, partial [Brassica oleracea var. botrytis]